MKTYLICNKCNEAFTAKELNEIHADRFRCPYCDGLLKAEYITEYNGKADFDTVKRLIEVLAHR